MGHFPGTMSVQNLLHYLQLMKSANMKLYDFGSAAMNTRHYGQPTPPIVELTNIKDISTGMVVGQQDKLADDTDSEWACDAIAGANAPTVLSFYEVVRGGYLSFFVGKH